VADVQIGHDAAASVECRKAPVHRLDRGAGGIGLLAAGGGGQQQGEAAWGAWLAWGFSPRGKMPSSRMRLAGDRWWISSQMAETPAAISSGVLSGTLFVPIIRTTTFGETCSDSPWRGPSQA